MNFTNTVSLQNANGISFGASGPNALTASYTVPSLGVSTQGNTAGNTGLYAGQAVLVGSGNITLAVSSAAGGAQTITISGAGGGGGQGVAVSAGASSQSSGTITFANSNGVSFGLANGVLTAQAAATATAGINGILAGTQSATTGSVSFANSNGVSFGLSNSSVVTASINAAGTATAFSGTNVFGSLTLNTSGLSLALSAGVGGAGLSAGTQSVNSGTVNFANSNGISFGMSASSQITASYTVPTQSAQTLGLYAVSNTTGASSSSTVDARSLSFEGAGAVSIGLSGGTVVVSAAGGAQSNQSLGVYGISNTTGQASSSTYDARSLSFVGAGIISIGQSGGSIQISAPGTTSFVPLSVGISTNGNTSGNTGIASNQLVLVGGNNVTLSGSTNAGSMTLTISGANAGGAQTGISGIQVSNTTYSAGTVTFQNANGITFGSSGANGISASFSVPPLGVSTQGNTSGNTGLYSGQALFVGGNNITLSVSSGAAGAQTITISGANAGGAQTGISGVQVSNTTYSAGTITLQNANGISFGSSGANGISASYTVPANQTGISGVQVSNTTYTSGTITFQNANGISFGSSGANGISASFTIPPLGVSTQGNTSGNTGLYSGQALFVGGNNITLSVSSGAAGAQTITISGANAGGAQTGISGLQVSNTTYSSGTVTFQNANGISFGSSGANGISASYTVPTQTNQTLGVYGLSNTTGQSSSSTYDARSLSFVGAGIISIGQSGGSVQISAPGSTSYQLLSAGFSTGGNTSGTTGLASNQLVLAGGNNITLSGSTNGGSMTITISGANAGGAQTGISGLQVSNTTYSSGTVTFQNANGISFGSSGANGISASYTVPTTIANSFGVSTQGNTSGNTGIYTGQALFVGGNNITLSVASAAGGAQTITISGANAGGAQTGISGLQVSNTTYSSGTVTFQNANGISFGSSGANGISASFTIPPFGVSTGGNTLGNTGVYSGQAVFVGGNNITLSVSSGAAGAQTVTISGANAGGAQTGISGVQVSNTTYSSGTITFQNANGISFGSSGANGISASYTVPTQTNQTLGLYGVGNTTQNSSTTLDARTLSFDGLGAMTVGFSNGSVQLSAPGTSSISGTGLVSISVNGSTISIGAQPGQLSFFQALPCISQSYAQLGTDAVVVYPAPAPQAFTATRADGAMSVATANLAASTYAVAVSMYVGLYSLNGSTLSLASSGSQSYQFTNSSNNSSASISGLRRLSVPIAVNYTGGYDLFVAVMTNTTFSNTQGVSLSQMVGPYNYPAGWQAPFVGGSTNSTMQYVPGFGAYSVTSAALPGSMAISQIYGAGALNAVPIINFANMTA